MARKEYELLFKLQAQANASFNSTFGTAQNKIATLQKELDALNKQQSKVTGYQKQQAAVAATEKQLAALQQQYDNIQREINETEGFSSELENRLISKQQQILRTNATLEKQTAKLNELQSELREAGVDTDDLAGEQEKLAKALDETRQAQVDAADEAASFGTRANAAFLAAGEGLAAAGIVKGMKEILDTARECADASMQFQSAMTGVAKTTDLTDAELAGMSAEVKTLATEIPIAQKELAAIGEVAGQLGVAKGDLMDFTKTMAMLSTATTMTADEGATMLAQFANITRMSSEYYDELAAATVDLGNNYATTEQKILDMAQGMAASASLAGIAEAQILGIAAAVSSLGIEAQAGSSSMSRIISDIMTAVETESEALEDFARVAGMSAEQFADAWRKDAASALEAFVTGLSDVDRNGQSAIATLTDLEITEIRMQRALLSLSNSGDLLSRAIGTANEAWEENVALVNEAQKRYATTESRLQMMQNAYGNLKIAIGDNYNPALGSLYGFMTDVLDASAQFVQQNPALVKAITAAVAVVGTATAAVVAYSAAVKMAKALNLASLFSGLAGPGGVVVLAAAGIAALTAATADYVLKATAMQEDAARIAEELDAVREAATAADEAMRASVDGADYTAETAERYINRLDELERQSVLTTQEQKEYAAVVESLRGLLPDVNIELDEQTGYIKGGTAALRDQVSAWKDVAKAQAMQDALTAKYKLATDAAMKASEAEKAIFDTYSMTVAQAQKYVAEQRGIFGRLEGDIEHINYVRGIEQLIAEFFAATQEAQKLEAEAESLADTAVETSDVVADSGDKVTGVISNSIGKLESLATAYYEAYEAAHESISGQYALWDEAADVTATSVSKMTAAMQEQAAYWSQYDTNLDSLIARGQNIEGLGVMLAHFADGSADSVNAVAGMAKATDAELAKMVKQWQSLQTEQAAAADALAQLQTAFGERLDAIETELSETIAGLDMAGEAYRAGYDTFSGYLDGVNAMMPAIAEAYKSVAFVGGTALYENANSRALREQERELITRGTLFVQANAAGTTNAANVFLAGERGPELIVGMGGSTVFPASETDRIISAVRGVEPAALATGGSVHIDFSPIYNLEGVRNADDLRAVLAEHGEQMRDFILAVVSDAEADRARRVYS